MQEDDIILAQQYCCVSWVDPISEQDLQDGHKLLCFFKEHVENQDNLNYENVLEDYCDYKNMYYKEIGGEFDCGVPYIKIRGAYQTKEMCYARIKQLESKYKDTEPVGIYCGLVGKWFPFLGNPATAEDPDLLKLMNKAIWDYEEFIKENDDEFQEHTKKIKITYKRTAFDPEQDYLTEDKMFNKYQFFCVSFFEPDENTAAKVREAYLKKFIYFFLSEEFKARYSRKGITEKEMPEFEHTEDSLWSAFSNSTFENKTFEKPGWKCFKLRGIYSSEAEAQKRAEYLQKVCRNYRVDVCRVGGWLPFYPPGHLLKSEYHNEELAGVMDGLNNDVDQETIQKLKELHLTQQENQQEDQQEEKQEQKQENNVEIL